jgi:rhodanese-related sulfurtransferase
MAMTSRTIGLLALVAALIPSSCRWREGRVVWIHDAGADADGFVDPCGAMDDPCWITAVDLDIAMDQGDTDITVIDIREGDACDTARIPGALCVPGGDGEGLGDVDCHDDRGWIVLYDWNGSAVPAALWHLPLDCERTIYLLIDGFGAWSECEPCPIENGEDDDPDAG